jgi:hypothetical protein
MKKISFYVLMLFIAFLLASCQEEVTIGPGVYQECRTAGMYDGRIVEVPLETNAVLDSLFDYDMWVWCEITKAPADAIDKKAPTAGSYIYFQRNDFPSRVLKPGMAVKYRIFYFGLILRESTNLPFQYADDYLYYHGNVMPDYLLNN